MYKKYNNKVVVKETTGTWPSKIAKYLELERPVNYTDHTFSLDVLRDMYAERIKKRRWYTPFH